MRGFGVLVLAACFAACFAAPTPVEALPRRLDDAKPETVPKKNTILSAAARFFHVFKKQEKKAGDSSPLLKSALTGFGAAGILGQYADVKKWFCAQAKHASAEEYAR